MFKEIRRRSTAFLHRPSGTSVANAPENVESVPLFGVNITLLKKLQKVSKDLDPEFAYFTSDIVETFIKSITKSRKMSLAMFLMSYHHDHNEPVLDINFRSGCSAIATVYVIHAWTYLFDDLVAALESYAEENKGDKSVNEIFFWLDICSVNQWSTNLPSLWFSKNLYEIIQKIGKSCLVLMPWKNPLPYRRCWCLFELFLSLLVNCTLYFQLSADRQITFGKMIVENYDLVDAAICRIVAIEQAACQSPSQKEAILSTVSRMHEDGIYGINKLIGKYLKDSLIETAISRTEGMIQKIRKEILSLTSEHDDSDDDNEDNNENENDNSDGNNERRTGNNVHVSNDSSRNGVSSTNTSGNNDFHDVMHGFARIEVNVDRNRSSLDNQSTNLTNSIDIDRDIENNLTSRVASRGSERSGSVVPDEEGQLTNAASKSTGKHWFDFIRLPELQSITTPPLVVFSKIVDAFNVKKLDTVDYESELERLQVQEILHLTSLATLFLEKGRVDKAESLYNEVLEQRTSMLGVDHPSLLSVYNNMAVLNKKLGRWDRAESMIRRAIQGKEKELGELHPSTISSAVNWASLLKSEGRYEDAIVAFRQVIVDQEEFFGLTHEDTLISYDHLIECFLTLRDYEQALTALKICIERRVTAFGEKHAEVAHSRVLLGLVLSKHGQLKQAAEVYSDAIESLEQIFSPNHPSTINACYQLAVVKTDMNLLVEADLLYDRVFQAYEATWGVLHPETRFCMECLAEVNVTLNCLMKAEKYYRMLLWANQEALGKDHPDTLKAAYWLGEVLLSMGECEDGLEFHQFAYQGRLRYYGNRHLSTVESMYGCGNAHCACFQLVQAQDLYKQALEGFDSLLGPEHPHSLYVAEALAQVCRSLGELDETELLYKKLIALYQKTMGPTHTSTLYFVGMLAELFSGNDY